MGTQYRSATIAVAVPTIADNDTGEVAVDTSAWEFAVAAGDGVIACPMEALPTDCSLGGAWASATDEITVTFTAQDGAVTGANKNFQFIVFDQGT